jgi:hypothetical protein
MKNKLTFDASIARGCIVAFNGLLWSGDRPSNYDAWQRRSELANAIFDMLVAGNQ